MGSHAMSFGGESGMQQQMRGRLIQQVLNVLGVGAAVVLLIAAITALASFFSGDTSGLHVLTNLARIALLVAFGTLLATLGQAILQGLVQGRAQARATQLEQIQEKIAALAAKNPDLAQMLEIMREMEASRQAESGRRAFWQGVAQNFVFYLLGVIVPVLLLGLHVGG